MTPGRQPLHESTALVGGLRMFVRTSARPRDVRPAVVLVHGAVISGRYMTPTAERLDAAFQLHIPDLPGFGRSEDPEAPLYVPGHATALVAWMDAVGLREAHFLGHSLGTQVVTELMHRYPERVTSAILVAPTVDRAARTRRQQLWRLARDIPRERLSLIPLHLLDMARAGVRFALSTLDIALADAIETKLVHATRPVLIVCGTRDPLAPPAWCRSLHALTPGAALREIDGPHALNYSRPVQLAEIVDAFLVRHTGRDQEPGWLAARTPGRERG